ncbi:MAG TPA: DUF2292 domain-containing protein [Actinomycetota bacterium]|nr:DUF2292 domain-containing protein [Actinomycetota bacterium]
MAQQDEPVGIEGVSEEEERVIRQVLDVLRRIDYGTVLLVVQDGKVVQIEMAEKFRLR